MDVNNCLFLSVNINIYVDLNQSIADIILYFLKEPILCIYFRHVFVTDADKTLECQDNKIFTSSWISSTVQGNINTISNQNNILKCIMASGKLSQN